MSDILNRVGAWQGLTAKSDGVTDVIKKTYVTKDIQELMIYADTFNAEKRYFKKLAQLLRGSNDAETCRNVYNFVRLNVKYVRDALNYDTVKSAVKTLEDGYGDCKVMTLTSGAILRELGINYRLRFVSYDNTKNVTHVYLIANTEGVDVIIDCVYHAFNRQANFRYFEDYYVYGKQNAAKINGIVESVGGLSLGKAAFFAFVAYVLYKNN